MAVTPRLGDKRLVAGFGCFAFLDCVWGNRLVGMQGVHMYLGYIGYGGRLCRAVMEMYMYVCVILYMRDGYIMDT